MLRIVNRSILHYWCILIIFIQIVGFSSQEYNLTTVLEHAETTQPTTRVSDSTEQSLTNVENSDLDKLANDVKVVQDSGQLNGTEYFSAPAKTFEQVVELCTNRTIFALQSTLNEKSSQVEESIRNGFFEVFENVASNMQGYNAQLSSEVKYIQKIIELQTQVAQFTFLDKEYFLIKELKTLDDADSFCKHRNQRLVQINSQQINDFIYNQIVKPNSVTIWLRASNQIGQTQFKWLDGSELTYSNWYQSFPNQDTMQRNGILMRQLDGKWVDKISSDLNYVLCERVNIFALAFELAFQNRQTSELIKRLDVRIKRLESRRP